MPQANVVAHDFSQGAASYQLVASEDDVAAPQVISIPYEGNRNIQVELRMFENCVSTPWCDSEPLVDIHIAPAGYGVTNLQVGYLSAGESYTDVHIDGGLGVEISVCNIDLTTRTATVVVQRPQDFVRGDSDGNGAVTLSDAVQIFSYLKTGIQPQRPMDVLDVNDDGQIDIADGVYLLSYLFKNGPEPSAPFTAPGQDGVSDFLPGLACQ